MTRPESAHRSRRQEPCTNRTHIKSTTDVNPAASSREALASPFPLIVGQEPRAVLAGGRRARHHRAVAGGGHRLSTSPSIMELGHVADYAKVGAIIALVRWILAASRSRRHRPFQGLAAPSILSLELGVPLPAGLGLRRQDFRHLLARCDPPVLCQRTAAPPHLALSVDAS